MEQAAEKTIRQFSAAIEQGLQPSRQHSEAIVTGAVHPDPEVQYHLEVNMDLLNSDPQPQNGLSVYDSGSLSIQDPVDLELGLPGRTNHQIYPIGHNTGIIGSVVDLALGPNKSDPIWRLRLLAAIIIAMIGVFVLPGYFQGVHTTYRRVMLVTTVGVPIVAAVISLFVSFWLASDGQNNWITGLSVANVSILVALYFVLKRGTGN